MAPWHRGAVAPWRLGAEATCSCHCASTQLEANRILVRKTAESVALVEAWAELALSRPDFFTDEPSAVPNSPDFVEHRHDQSVFNLLMHARGWTGSSCKSWGFLEATRRRE